MTLSAPHPLLVEPFLREALREDMGRAGDITTDAIAPPGLTARVHMTLRKDGVACGIALAGQVFGLVDPTLSFTARAADGERLDGGTVAAVIEGPARGILTGERLALNLFGRLSGIATLTRRFVDAVEGTGAAITCTRKTTPGLRILEKFAVRAGGGRNHRFGLDDAVLIKDNHVAVAGGVGEAVRRARAAVGHMVRIEVEVDTLDQLAEVLEVGGADVVLLDNMGPDLLRRAVEMVGGRMVTEASGGITLDTVRAAAESGVDVISLGFLTHSAQSLDVGLDFAG
jgi:nicotinate-nucleotide pyrophosphorylase (carboxylating)